LPRLWEYKDKYEVLKMLAKKDDIDYGFREGISWFFGTYLRYLNMKGDKTKLKELFNKYKRFIESNVSGVEVVPDDERYYTAIFKVDEKADLDKKFEIAESVAKLTTEFVYNHLINDEELSYLREIFEDFVRRSDETLDGFRYYEYKTTAPWGDEYTVKAYLAKYDRTHVKLDIYILKRDGDKGEKMLAFDSVVYSIHEITNGRIGGIPYGRVRPLPIRAGLLSGVKKNRFIINLFLKHDSQRYDSYYAGRGNVYVIE